jgi:hypothetical protein
MFPPAEKPAPPVKGELQELKITGKTAQGKYAVKQGDSAITQDIAFESMDGSWKMSGFVFFVGPGGG